MFDNKHMKLLIPLLFTAISAIAETNVYVYSQAALAPAQGGQSNVEIRISDTAPPPAWYGVDLRYVDSGGNDRKLYFVCERSPAVAVPFNGKFDTVCIVYGLKISSGEATAARPD